LKQIFYSNGKLLVTGEYTVLDGAKALALPTVYGQYLHVEEGSNKIIKWVSKDGDGTVWLDIEIPFSDILNNHCSQDSNEYKTLVKILHEAHSANRNILTTAGGITVTTELSFPRQWGLGTSSTLINNIAQWFSIDAFKLLDKSFGGSGYDIACAQNNTPIVYQLKDGEPIVKPVEFNPSFTDNLYFVYLNQKQNSRSAIASYREKNYDSESLISQINLLTEAALQAENLQNFQNVFEKHEEVMSEVLDMPTVKKSLFPDFKGTVKSLGAWGGDFVLAASETDPKEYFRQKGYNILLPYNKMILK
jgi:mevalonate kinase